MLYDVHDTDNNKPIIPETGMVIKGTKYIIRTDVMYEANQTETKEEKENE